MLQRGWRIETVVSARIRLETIQKALQSTFWGNEYEQIQLVTDGGQENDNFTIKEFIQTTNTNHTVALRDIKQSNSMMEAFYRTSKYHYLYLKQILNGKQLKLEFQNWIQEYDFEKPHYALGIYSPSEVLDGADLSISHKASFLETALKQREINKNSNCTLKCD